MRKRTMIIPLICILLLAFTMIIFVFVSGRRPYKDLEAAQIVSATVQLSPPDKTIQITETKELVVRTGNPCAYFRSISPIAQVKKPRRSTTTSAFFDLHSRKNILRNMHKDFRYGLLVDLLKDVVVYNKDNSYTDYSGQGVTFTLVMIDGTQTSIMEYNPFLVIDGVGYKTKYEPCEALNHYANRLLEEEDAMIF